MRVSLTLVLVSWGGLAHAQELRSFSTFRQMHGDTRLTAQLEYAAGILRVGAGPAGELYRMELAYDAARYVPVSDFDNREGSVVLGLNAAGEGGVRVVSRDQLRQVAAVTLSPEVDLTLSLRLGAAEAEVDLGGMRVRNFAARTGASRTLIRFSRPNPARCQVAAITAGAAEVTVMGLGNSRCDEIQFEGGVGRVTLDFSGAWSSSSQAKIRMAMGGLTLRLPRQVGVRLQMDKFLSSFDPVGLVGKGDFYESPGYSRAERHLNIDLTTAVGGVTLEWEGSSKR
jgi:hypothetical protein